MEPLSETIAWLTRSDGSGVIGHGAFTESAEPPKIGVAFYVQDFGLSDPRPWKIPSRHQHLAPGELALQFPDSPRFDPTWEPLEAVPFSEVFQEVMSSIQDGTFEKTVPVVTESGEADLGVGAAIMAAMARRSAPLHSYGWKSGVRGFAGATPEQLFSIHGNHLKTMALAGTARSEDRGVFAVDEKEIREHEYVAQSLITKLLDLGQVQRCAREILNLGSIVHFLTSIELELEIPQTAVELLRRLHPTPALGPLPRTAETMAQLLEWRERLGCPAEFGAPFGLWDEGRFDAIVAIRGIWWNGSKILLPAGCGVIEASRLVNEWRELRLKREAVKNYLRA